MIFLKKFHSCLVSLGARFAKSYDEHVHSSLTVVANPVMGHLTTAYMSTILPNLDMATQCEFNMYSFETDLSLGIEFAPPGSKQMLKAKIGFLDVNLLL